MSTFPHHPVSHNVQHRYQVPIKVSETVYDFVLASEGADYVYNVSFHTHPLLLERIGFTDHYRLSAADIDYVQILVDGHPVSTISNTYRDEPVCLQSQMGGIYSVENIAFFNGDPIATALLNNDIVLRVVFWRAPVAPFWITFTLANSVYYFGNFSWNSWAISQVQAYDGQQLIYQWGSMIHTT